MDNRLKRPDAYILTNTVRHWDENHDYFCNEAFYTYALRMINKRYYIFPSTYIGQYGSYEALRHVYSKCSNHFGHLLKENSILASREHFLDDIQKGRSIIRKQFRDTHKIEDSDTVVFLSPGNTIEENKYTMEAFRRGYNEFIGIHSYPTSLSHHAPNKESFKLVISIQKGVESEQYIRDFIKNYEFVTQVIIVTDENNEHFDSICVKYY